VVLVVVGLLAVAALLDLLLTYRTMTRRVEQVRTSLEQAAERLGSGDLARARTSFDEAREAAREISGVAGRPAARLASVLPWVGDDVDALGTLAKATELAAQAGEHLVLAATAAGWDGLTIPGYGQGRWDLEPIRVATPDLQAAAALLHRAGGLVRSLDPSGKVGPLAEAIVDAREMVGERSEQVERVSQVAGLLPGLLGGEGARTYAIVMMTLSDPRGSGGYPGSYGVLRVDDGVLALEELAPTSTLGTVPPVEAPPDVVRRYERFGGLTHFISSTYPPDWPTAARIWMAMWEASGRPRLDGVIGADSVWMRYLLEAIGPVETPAWPEPLTSETVSRILDADTMRTDSHDESDAWQAQIATALWTAMVTRPAEPVALGSALSRATAERHLQVFSAHAEEQALLEELGAGGQVEMPEDPLMVSWSGFVGSRTGYFARKSLGYRATVNGDGTADVTIRIELENTAPTEPESILLGFDPGPYPVGTYVAAANVYLPAEATRVRSRVDGGRSLVDLFEREFDRRVVLTVLVVDAGETTSAEITFRMPVDVERFELGMVPQPELSPTEVAVSVAFPGAVRLLRAPPGTSVEGSTISYEGTPTEPLVLLAAAG
jgi:hypothetical protein